MAEISIRRISNIPEEALELTEESLVPLAEKVDDNVYVTKKFDLRKVDNFLEYDTFQDFPTVGRSKALYIDTTTNILYRWDGVRYVALNVGGVGGGGEELPGWQPEPVPDYTVYGVKYDYLNDVMYPGVLVDGEFVIADYQNFYIQDKVKRVLYTAGGLEFELNHNDSSKLITNEMAIIDGSPIEGYPAYIMSKIPAFHMLAFTDSASGHQYILVSEGSFDFNGIASWIPFGFGDRSYKYIGSFEGTAMTDSLEAPVGSVINAVHHPNGLDTSGYTVNPYPAPFTNRTIRQFRTQCSSPFMPYTWGAHQILYTLFVTKYKTWNSQAVLPGHTWRGVFDYNLVTKPGATYTLGNKDGYVTDQYGNAIANSFLGVENFFGNVWKWLHKIDRTLQTTDIRVFYEYSTSYRTYSRWPIHERKDGYISRLYMSPDYPTHIFYPTALDGSSSTFMCDYMTNDDNASPMPVVVGGIMNSQEKAGIINLDVQYSDSVYRNYIGCRIVT